MSGKSPKAGAKGPKKKARRHVKRAEPQSFRARTLAAALTVRDLTASVAWYQTVLGFVKGEEYAWNGKVGAVQLKAGAVEIVLNQDDGAKGFDRVKGEGFSLQFTTAQDIDTIARWAKDTGAVLTTEPTTVPWGARMFRITDPDGFKIVIST